MSSLAAALTACVAAPPQELSPGKFTAAFLFPPEFIGFSGHFPANPVLPGIVQIMAALCTCGASHPLILTGIKSCKFLRPVLPDQCIAVTATLTAADAHCQVTADLRLDDAPCATMTLYAVRAGNGGRP